MNNDLADILSQYGINPVKFEQMRQLDQLKALSKIWDKIGNDEDNLNKIDSKQKIIQLKQQIKHSKNPMEIKQLQREIGKLSKHGN